MPRWLAHLLVAVGWLLTPVLAWAASYVGLWGGALIATRFANPVTMLVVAGATVRLAAIGSLSRTAMIRRPAPDRRTSVTAMAPKMSIANAR